jgi:hypothetical protein
MSCLGPNYNPVPPRAWSRVENRCAFDENVPLNTNLNQILKKGNILQYKKNSSNLTQKQRYSQIAKGKWTNRTTTWASQTQTTSNPNTLNLQQIDYDVIPIPENLQRPNEYGCINTFIKDGGILVGNTYVNPCTDEVIKKTYVQQCYPSTCSDVPGTPVLLCWKGSLQTWYPKSTIGQKMTNSGDKWPINYKLFKSANDIPSGSKINSLSYYQNFSNANLYGSLTNMNKNQVTQKIENIYNIYNTFSTGGSGGGNGGTISNSVTSGNVNTNLTSTNAALTLTAGNVNVNILPDPVPNYLDFSQISAGSTIDLSLNSNTAPYEDLRSRTSYTLTNPGVYIAQNTAGYTNIALPGTIKNWKEITIMNKTDHGLNVLVNDETQTISNYFFAKLDQYVALATNNTAQFKFVSSGPDTTEGNWILNLF